MNAVEFSNALGKVGDRYVMEAASYERKKRGGWLKWGVLAACLCLAVVGAAVWKAHNGGIRFGAPYDSSAWITVSEDGVTIAPMDVHLSKADDVEMDMIGFFIYQGRCYVQYEWIYEDVDIIGGHLGTATGLIDEWTPKEGYVELAGSVRGDFYAVKGYDPAFMLCMKEPTGAVSTYICNNGITLKYGSELYEDRLRLSGNIASVEYESRDSWYHSRNERYELGGVDGAVLDFIAGMDGAEFVPYDRVALDEGVEYLADTELYHLYFRMKDGTTVHLRLHENGYVRFNGMWELCVQVPEESYRALLALLDGRGGSTALEPEPVRPTFEDCRNDPELGRYVPTYAPEDMDFIRASIYYELDSQTGAETGTKQISLSYEDPGNVRHYYTVAVTREEDYGYNGWDSPVIDAAGLSVEAIAGRIETTAEGGEPLPESRLDLGVRYGGAFVMIYGYGVDAETAFAVLSSVG